MKKQKYFSRVFLTIVLAMVICLGSTVARATTTVALLVVDQQLIKKVVNDYFDKRFLSLKNLQLADFSSLVANSLTNDAMKKELEKLDLTVYRSKVFQLQLLQYKFSLDFGDITYDPENLTATVNIAESSDVVYIATAPSVSSSGKIGHIIILQKENGFWKISADKYEDLEWKILKGNNLTDAELRKQIDDAYNQYDPSMKAFSSTSPYELQSDAPCTFHGINVCYDRMGAAAYADQWALSYNSNYYQFPLDCTNFVSQAIYGDAGGGISQVFDAVSWAHRSDYQIVYDQYGSSWPVANYFGNGFYYYSFSVYYMGQTYPLANHSTSWTGVDQLHSFLVPGPTNTHFAYLGGPIARELNPNGNDPNDLGNLRIGDIIQFDWDKIPESDYDHSVIVDDIQGSNIFFDDHATPSHKHVLLQTYLSTAPKQVRYIHINDRLQLAPQFVPLVSNMAIPNIATQLSNQAYPAPFSTNNSPSSTPSNGSQAYPAP